MSDRFAKGFFPALSCLGRSLAFLLLTACGSRASLLALGEAPHLSERDDAGDEGSAASHDDGGATAPTGGPASCARGLVVLASGQYKPSGIALGSAEVFWTNLGPYTDGTVVKVPKCGGAPLTLASGQGDPQGIAVDSNSVYWPTAFDSAGVGTVAKVSLSGGTTTTLFAAASGGGFYDMAVDEANVYWATYASVGRVPRDGGAPEVVVSGQEGVRGLTLDATNVYWANQGPGAVMRLPKAGGTPETLAAGQSVPNGVAVASANIYWTNNSNPGSVVMVAASGGVPTTLAAGRVYPDQIAVDATHAYWTEGLADQGKASLVMKIAIDGGAPVTVASGQANPDFIAVDDSSLYWSNDGTNANDFTDGSIMRLTPK